MAKKAFPAALLALLLIHTISAIPINLGVVISGGAGYTASPAITLALSADNTTAATNCSLSNDNSAWSDPAPFAASTAWNLSSGDGAKSVYFRCTDDGENWSSVASGGIILDTSPPAIGSFSPGNGTVTTDPRAAISVSLSDPGSGINSSSIILRLDGSAVASAFGSGTASYTPGSDLSETRHYADVTAYDKAGNSAYANWSFTVDRAPVIGPVYPAAGAFLSSTSFTLTAPLSDSGSGINSSATNLTVDGNVVTANATFSSGTLSYPAAVAEGNHTVALTIRDLSGNPASKSWIFMVDKSDPAIGSMTPAQGSQVYNVSAISAFITDDFSGVNLSTLKMVLDGIDVTSGADYASGLFYLVPSRMAGGNHTVEVWANDRSGNTGYASWTFSVFSKAPVVDSFTPAEGSATNNAAPQISARVTDSGASGLDLSSLKIYLDGSDVSAHASYDSKTRVISFVPQSGLREGNHTAEVAIADNIGNSGSRSWSFSVDVSPPQNPAGLSVSPIGGGTMLLSWQPLPDASTYKIYRSANASKSLSGFSLLTSVSLPNYTDPGAPARSYYAVTGVDGAGNEGEPAFAASCASYGNDGWEDYACCSDSDCGGALCNTSSHSCYTPQGYVSEKDAQTRIQDVQGELSAAEAAGKNVTEAEALLNQSRDSLNSGNYSMAVQLADQAMLSLQAASSANETQAGEPQKQPLPGCGSSAFVLLGIMAAALILRD